MLILGCNVAGPLWNSPWPLIVTSAKFCADETKSLLLGSWATWPSNWLDPRLVKEWSAVVANDFVFLYPHLAVLLPERFSVALLFLIYTSRLDINLCGFLEDYAKMSFSLIGVLGAQSRVKMESLLRSSAPTSLLKVFYLWKNPLVVALPLNELKLTPVWFNYVVDPEQLDLIALSKTFDSHSLVTQISVSLLSRTYIGGPSFLN